MFWLLLKLSAFLLTGLIALPATNKATAARRHLLCVCTLAGSLLLPLGALVPAKPIAFRTLAIDAAVRRSPAASHAFALPWSAILMGVWMLGTVLLLLRLAVGYWRFAQLKRAGTPLEAPLFAADVNVPIVAGLWRPAVLLPRDVSEWPCWQRDAAIRHELAHIERKDLWANFLANTACALYWFHPLVWTVAAHLRAEQEAACDDTVVGAGFDPAAYAEALLTVAKNSNNMLLNTRLLPGCPMTTHNDVKSRITRLLTSSKAPHSTLRRSAVAFAGIALAFAALIPLQAQKIYTVADGVTSPRVLQKVDVQYTEEARRDKVQGTVQLSFVVQEDGKAHDINVTKSLDPGLDRNAATALEQWHFAPGTLDGQVVAVRAVVEINFRLE
jgi:TonB family protein